MSRMTKLNAFKGRERGQNARRKQEAVEKAIENVFDGIRSGWTKEMAKQAARPDWDQHFRFPR